MVFYNIFLQLKGTWYHEGYGPTQETAEMLARSIVINYRYDAFKVVPHTEMLPADVLVKLNGKR